MKLVAGIVHSFSLTLIFLISVAAFAANSPVHKAEMLSGNAADGKQVYESVCAACHRNDGMGMAGAFPPVNNSDYLKADIDRSISAVVNGLSGKIKVNGKQYNAAMPPMGYLSDSDIAAAFS